VVLEFRADGFLPQQVRRVVASIVAIHHGWLPETFFETATAIDLVRLETGLAPASRCLFAGSRYDFFELKHGSLSFQHDGTPPEGGEEAWWETVSAKALSTAASHECEEAWLACLKGSICPRIRAQLALYKDTQDTAKLYASYPEVGGELGPCPGPYLEVLRLLQQASTGDAIVTLINAIVTLINAIVTLINAIVTLINAILPRQEEIGQRPVKPEPA